MRALKSFLFIALWISRYGGTGMSRHQFGVLIFLISWYEGPYSKFSPPIAGKFLPKDYYKHIMGS